MSFRKIVIFIVCLYKKNKICISTRIHQRVDLRSVQTDTTMFDQHHAMLKRLDELFIVHSKRFIRVENLCL